MSKGTAPLKLNPGYATENKSLGRDMAIDRSSRSRLDCPSHLTITAPNPSFSSSRDQWFIPLPPDRCVSISLRHHGYLFPVISSRCQPATSTILRDWLPLQYSYASSSSTNVARRSDSRIHTRQRRNFRRRLLVLILLLRPVDHRYTAGISRGSTGGRRHSRCLDLERIRLLFVEQNAQSSHFFLYRSKSRDERY